MMTMEMTMEVRDGPPARRGALLFSTSWRSGSRDRWGHWRAQFPNGAASREGAPPPFQIFPLSFKILVAFPAFPIQKIIHSELISIKRLQ
jgi:hypothetical protein